MVDKTVKENLRSKLSAVGTDLKQSKIRQRINGVELIDGKLKAEFSVSGLPTSGKNDDYMGSYRDFTKIFDDFGQFSEYSSKFFAMSDKEIESLCKKEK